jgi:transcriptional regulator with XRE-family HTH domain
MMNPDGIASLLQHLRKNSGRLQREIAEEIAEEMGEEFSVQNVKRWEEGQRVPTPRYRDAVAKVYGVPRREIDKAVDATKRAERLDKITLNGTEYTVDRRAFLGTAAIVAGAAAEPWGRLAAALGGCQVDAETVQALQLTTEGMFESEEHIPARLMKDRLAAHLDALIALLPKAGQYRAALAIAAGETAALAGWMAYDIGDHAQAAHYYRVAVEAGREAGHGAVAALALGYGSYAVPADRARPMVADAQQHVRGPGYATARAWLSAREAEEAARLGDRDGALRAIERAQTAFDYADPAAEQAWVRFFRRARLGSMAISAYSQIGHPQLAAVIADALADLGDDDTKIRCSVLGDSALGWLAAGDVEQAVDVGTRALAATVEDDTTMGRSRLAALATQLPDGVAADELRERIRAVLPA